LTFPLFHDSVFLPHKGIPLKKKKGLVSQSHKQMPKPKDAKV
jgi:hypothetical protein